MRLPDFIIIGAAKSGTTTLYEYLCRHPEIYMSTPKEPEFFARDDQYAKGLNWYASLFCDATPEQVCGEASTIYSLYPHFPSTAERIFQAVPNVKLIYIMRHPVDRAYSYYIQLIKNAQNTKLQLEISHTFEECISHDKNLSEQNFYFFQGVNSHLPRCRDLYIDGSNYFKQIKQYMQFFSRESILFLFMDDLISQPKNCLRKVCQFIGVDESVDLVRNKAVKANLREDHMERILRTTITDILRKTIFGYEKIIDKLPIKFKNHIYNLVKLTFIARTMEDKYVPKPMLPTTRLELLEEFRKYNNQLAEFLDCDLSHWNK